MFSESFLNYLMNYQKDEFIPKNNEKEIHFNKKGGKLVRVTVEVEN